jgi:hypothetical protein
MFYRLFPIWGAKVQKSFQFLAPSPKFMVFGRLVHRSTAFYGQVSSYFPLFIEILL